MTAISLDKLTWRTEREKDACEGFVALTHKFSHLPWTKCRNPWQVDVKVPSGNTYSFWPHKLKMVNHKGYVAFDLRSWDDAVGLLTVASGSDDNSVLE